MLVTTLLCLLPLLSLSSAIINGTIAKRNEYPFMVSLQWDGEHKCGGTLINANTVLTAAHCYPLVWVDPKQPNRVTALLGNTNQHARGRRVSIKRIIWPDGFPQKYKSKEIMKVPLTKAPKDYLIIKLAKKVQANAGIQYARLGDGPGGPLTPKIGDQCDAIGWGRYKYPDVSNLTAEIFPKFLRRGLVKVVQDRECWGDVKPVPLMFCAQAVVRSGQSKGFPCFGDSGSPLICKGPDRKHYVAGFVEAGNVPCNNPRAETLFMRLAPMRRWIDEKS